MHNAMHTTAEEKVVLHRAGIVCCRRHSHNLKHKKKRIASFVCVHCTSRSVLTQLDAEMEKSIGHVLGSCYNGTLHLIFFKKLAG